MRFSLVDGVRHPPSPKLKGICPNCGSDMVAKCGRVKIWHWAHKGNDHCDQWWENETQWHRDWKDNFPIEWQEISHADPITGERHIADIKTPHGLTIEFQHSRLKEEERMSREKFYENLVWVVDGLRGDLDKAYFDMGLSGPIQRDPLAYQVQWYGRGRFLHNWEEKSAKVFLDFGGENLWRFPFFEPEEKRGMVGPVPKSAFIEDCLRGEPFRAAVIDDDDSSKDMPRPMQEIYRSNR